MNTNGTTQWVILEAMGHIKVAGRYYVENGLHRVDIPDPTDLELYRTEWFGNAAIFRITPVDEVTARAVAKQSVIPDAIPWDMRGQLKQLAARAETLEQMREDLGPDGQGEGFDYALASDYDDLDDDDDRDPDDLDDRPDPEDIPF